MPLPVRTPPPIGRQTAVNTRNSSNPSANLDKSTALKNPAAEKLNICTHCDKAVQSTEDSLWCSLRRGFEHRQCSSVTVELFKAFNKAKCLQILFFCKACTEQSCASAANVVKNTSGESKSQQQTRSAMPPISAQPTGSVTTSAVKEIMKVITDEEARSICSALSPDYTLTLGSDDEELLTTAKMEDGVWLPKPVEAGSVNLNGDLQNLVAKFAEHFHDMWASKKVSRSVFQHFSVCIPY